MSSGPCYLLDTWVLLDMIQSPSGLAGQRFKALLGDNECAVLCTSVIVQCELQFRLSHLSHPRWQLHYHRLMDSLEVLALESDAASHFSKLRNWSELNGFRLTASDLLIAAHAMAKDAILVSPEEGLTQVPGLKLQNWLT